MKTILSISLLIAVLCYNTCAYSLQGRWGIKSQYLPTDVNATVTFEKQINSTNSRIVYYMNVFACRLIRYRYIVVDNQIYLTFDEFVTERYPCKTNQINTLRNKLQMVFFFYIVGSELAFYGANGQAQFQMSRIPISSPKSLSGEWLTIDVNGASIQESFVATESSFELCMGKGVVGYKIPSASKSQISFEVQKVSGCPQNQVFSTLNRAKFFRWRSANLVFLYDSTSERIMTLRKIRDIIEVDSPASTSQTPSTTIQSKPSTTIQSNPTNPQMTNPLNTPQNNNKNTQVNTNSVTPSPVKPISPVPTTPEANNSASTPQNQPQTNASPNPVIPENNKAGTSPVQPTVTVPNTVQPKIPSTQPVFQPPVPKTEIKNPMPTAPTAPVVPKTPEVSASSAASGISARQYKSMGELPAITGTQFAGKWLIMDQEYSSAVYKYFFLMVGDRITLYGDCQVHLTTFTLNNATLNNINIRSITSASSAYSTSGFSCEESRQRVAGLIEKWRKWKYVAIETRDRLTNIQLLDANFAVLNQLQKI